MSEPALTIRDLRIRVPGMGAEAARRLGEAVARELAAHPPVTATPRRISALDLRIRATGTGGVQPLAAQIAASLRASLQ